MIVENLMNSIERGKKGLNIGLSTGLPAFDSLTFGVQRRWMSVWAGDSGRNNCRLVDESARLSVGKIEERCDANIEVKN